MSPEQITAAAVRNQGNRAAMLARLATARRPGVRAKLADLTQAREGIEDRQEQLQEAEALRHIPGFYPTPPKLIERMLAAVGSLAGLRVLEPSAGRGDLADAAIAAGAAAVDCFEVAERLRAILQDKGLSLIGEDFAAAVPVPAYDAVLMNPPFERRQDVAHVRHAFRFLRPGGRLVAIVGQVSGIRLEPFAAEHRGEVVRLPAGSFLTSDRITAVNTSLVTLFA